MQNLRAAIAAALMFACGAGLSILGVAFIAASPASAAWDKPWKAEDRALVIDAYEFNPIDWQELTSDKRIVGFINKASDGMPPEWNCRGKSGDAELLCKNRWWKYSVTKELYMTRRAMAKALGLEWGAYHLARPGNPREQADHFIDFAEPEADDLIAIDIEDNNDEWMSLADAEIFANQIFIRTGRYPVLYTNGSTAKYISDHKATYTLLSRLPLWYARYREDITGLFPETTWPSYALWQFSSMHNCSERSCPYRVKGAKTDIDVNVSPLDVAGLKAAWPFDELITPLETPAEPSLVARLGAKAGEVVASIAGGLALLAETKAQRSVAPAAADIASADKQKTIIASNYAPADDEPSRLDPLAMITATALAERRESAARDALDAATKGAVGAKGSADTQIGKHAPVVTATLGVFESLKGDMASVATMADRTKKATEGAQPDLALPLFGRAEKSRFREMLKASEDRIPSDSVLADGSGFGSQEAGGRGPRLTSRLSGIAQRGPASVTNRIASAFQATR